MRCGLVRVKLLILWTIRAGTQRSGKCPGYISSRMLTSPLVLHGAAISFPSSSMQYGRTSIRIDVAGSSKTNERVAEVQGDCTRRN
jgi:hypothetical protein